MPLHLYIIISYPVITATSQLALYMIDINDERKNTLAVALTPSQNYWPVS